MTLERVCEHFDEKLEAFLISSVDEAWLDGYDDKGQYIKTKIRKSPKFLINGAYQDALIVLGLYTCPEKAGLREHAINSLEEMNPLPVLVFENILSPIHAAHLATLGYKDIPTRSGASVFKRKFKFTPAPAHDTSWQHWFKLLLSFVASSLHYAHHILDDNHFVFSRWMKHSDGKLHPIRIKCKCGRVFFSSK